MGPWQGGARCLEFLNGGDHWNCFRLSPQKAPKALAYIVSRESLFYDWRGVAVIH